LEADKKFGDREITLLNQFAELASIALDNARLYTIAQQELAERKRVEEALRESEEKYRTLFRNSKDPICIVTSQGKILEVNDAWLNLYGYTKEEVETLSAYNLWANPRDRTKFQEEIGKTGCVKDYEAIGIKKNGEKMYCLITSTLWRDKGGNTLGYQTVVRDTTERRKLEQELLKVQKLESIGILAGGIAHDFNNILTAILLNISLAKTSMGLEEETLERLTKAEKASLRARDLTRQLLTFSKGGTPVKKAASMAEILKDSVNFVLRGSKVRCEFSIPEDLWPVEVDMGQMSQVIQNLIINAIEAMPEGGIIWVQAENITVGAELAIPLPEKNYIKISIQDQGTGIPRESLPKVFDPYFTTKPKRGGLGLAITYSIIKKHDGYITVESEPGIGTTFYIYLPASQKSLLIHKDPEKSPLGDRGKVLMMDDEEMVRGIAGDVITHLGYQVEFAKDGVEAIELYKKSKELKHPFDVVILDLTIPGGMGGKETIQRLLEIDPQVKALVSSGYSDDPIMANPKCYGFRGVVPKPYNIEELGETLHKVIRNKGE
ncbi:MAG: PAS domain S-box protein, partial [Nitrospira sp.]|nr:PAS domain S-box protein [Nitrospira sp.]